MKNNKSTHDATASLKGRVLINSKESKELGKLIRKCVKNNSTETLILSEDTKEKLWSLKT